MNPQRPNEWSVTRFIVTAKNLVDARGKGLGRLQPKEEETPWGLTVYFYDAVGPAKFEMFGAEKARRYYEKINGKFLMPSGDEGISFRHFSITSGKVSC